MSIAILLTLVGIWAAAVAVPGPDLAQVVRLGMRSTRAGLWCALGSVSGLVFWLTASLAGLSALITHHPSVLGFLQLFGGAYLIYMGYSQARSIWKSRRKRATTTESSDGVSHHPGEPFQIITKKESFRTGLTTNLSNPKVVIFFGAIFSQFITPDMGVWWTMLVAAAMLAVSTAMFVTYALLIRVISKWLMRHSTAVDAVTAAVFGVLGIVIMIRGIGAVLG